MVELIKIHSKILVGVMSISLLLTACGRETKEITGNTSVNENTQVQKSDSQKQGENKERKRGQRPDLFGRVKSIIGNEVVLELAEMPQREAGEKKSKQGSDAGERPINPEGKIGGGPEQRGGKRQLKFTGETKTILIPVGIPIKSFSRREEELDIADIYEGSLLQIWLDEDDKETITRVSVAQGR